MIGVRRVDKFHPLVSAGKPEPDSLEFGLGREQRRDE